MTKIIAIRCKATGEFISFGPKCAWATTGAAKSAYALHSSKLDGKRHLFVNQDEYEIVDLTEAYYRLEGLDK
jgi:hypothetical protein